MTKLTLQKQKPMRRMLIALAPVLIFAIYSFGWRVGLMTLVSIAFALLAEAVFEAKRGGKISEAAIVTGLLFALTLPARTPFWVVALGVVFGMVFAKGVFGGFGRNCFNPALVGRAFVYISFAKYLTAQWSTPATGFPGGFGVYLTEPIDALSASTPMLIYRDSGQMAATADLFLGRVAGSVGETSALLILLGGLYLLWTKTAAKETVLSVFAGFLLLALPFYWAGLPSIPPPLFGLLSGGFFFGAFFMATDPITSPRTFAGRIVYGLLIGAITVVIRGFALFPGAFMFAVMIANSFGPIIDETVRAITRAKKAKGAVQSDG